VSFRKTRLSDHEVGINRKGTTLYVLELNLKYKEQRKTIES
jgi:hypothetical protein